MKYFLYIFLFFFIACKVVIYCGENDLASSDAATGTMTVDRFKQLYQMIRKETEIPIVYIAMKPGPRRHLFSKMREANQMIKDFLSAQKNAAFTEIDKKMLNNAGEPIPAMQSGKKKLNHIYSKTKTTQDEKNPPA